MKKTLWILFGAGLILFILFGTMMLIEGQKSAKNTSEETLINETYQSEIKNIKVNGKDAAVKIKKVTNLK